MTALHGLVFVTSNPGKAREASRFLGRTVEARALDIPEIQEIAFDVVARDKALRAAERLGVAVLVEDSGLSIRAWNGFPGALTKWITGDLGSGALARMLDGFGDRSAEAVSALAVARPGDPAVTVAIGRVSGSISSEPRGTNGFGWDVVFVPEGGTRTWAELSPAEKDRDSHRARAFETLRRALSVTADTRRSPSS